MPQRLCTRETITRITGIPPHGRNCAAGCRQSDGQVPSPESARRDQDVRPEVGTPGCISTASGESCQPPADGRCYVSLRLSQAPIRFSELIHRETRSHLSKSSWARPSSWLTCMTLFISLSRGYQHALLPSSPRDGIPRFSIVNVRYLVRIVTRWLLAVTVSRLFSPLQYMLVRGCWRTAPPLVYWQERNPKPAPPPH